MSGTQGGAPKKTIDVPSSNFANSVFTKKSSKYAGNYEAMKSVPTSGPNHKNPQILDQLPLDPKYKEMQAGTDLTRIERMHKEKLMKEKLAQQTKKVESAPSTIVSETAKETAKIASDNAIQSLPTDIRLDDQGRIRDKEGNLVNLPVG